MHLGTITLLLTAASAPAPLDIPCSAADTACASARAAIEQLEPQFVALRAMTLGADSNAITRDLKRSIQALARLDKAYRPLITPDQPLPSIAALARTAMAYEHLADLLLGAPAPAQLTPDQQEMYRAALQEKAFPLQERAQDMWLVLLQRAGKAQVYTAHVLSAVAATAGELPLGPPELTLPGALSSGQVGLGLRAWERGDVAGALAAFEQAAKASPDDPVPYLNIMEVAAAYGHVARALAASEAVVKRGVRTCRVLLLRAAMELRGKDQGKMRQAVQAAAAGCPPGVVPQEAQRRFEHKRQTGFVPTGRP